MRAMFLEATGGALLLRDTRKPVPGELDLLLRVEACGVCRTDLHIIDGDLASPKLPLIPGHEIVGRIEATGSGVTRFRIGQRVGIPWLGATCGHCAYCLEGRENLCDAPEFTGYTRDGGFAEYCVARAAYAFALPEDADPVALAPLMCAGLIGYRALRMAGPARKIGIFGFGAAAHILCQIAVWAGASDEPPPCALDASLIFAPVGALVPQSLKSLRKGGTVVSAGIHMSDIPGFPYADLWQERVIRSVANLTRADGEAFFPLARQAGVRTHTTPYPLECANDAIDHLRRGLIKGAAVLVP
jgi:propanol-preferring alcohol dehydrogenase